MTSKPRQIQELRRMLFEVFSVSTRRKLILLVLGTTFASVLDLVGVLAMVPLMSALSGDMSATIAGAKLLDPLLPPTSSPNYMLAAAGLLAGAFILKAVFGLVFRWWASGVLAHEHVRVASNLMRRHLLAPYSMHRRRGYAELSNVLGTVVGMAFRAISTVLGIIAEVLSLLMLAVAVMIIQPVLAIASFALIAILGFVFQRVVRARQERLGRLSIQLSQASGAATLQAYGGAQEVKLRDNAGPFVDEFERANSRSVDAQRQLGFLAELPKHVFEIVFVFVLAGAAVVLFLTTGGSGASLVALATFGVAGVRMLPSAVRLLGSAGALKASWPGVEALLEEYDELDELDEHVPPLGEVSFAGDLNIDGVSFAYADAPDIQVLKGVALRVPRGSSVALVGPSGSGKSTLVDLVLGLQRAGAGLLTSGGLDIWTSIGDWRADVAVVPQEVFLLNDTLRKNIVFDVPDEAIDEDLLADVVRRAQLDDLVSASADGLDLVVGDRGARISGGQRQRVGIARALYRRPRLLVLDEATSALDNITEQRITETITALHGDITVVVVAHRLSTIRDVDQFVVLDGGRVVATGSFDDVEAQSPLFAELVRLASLRRS
ncbi:hypothetical protein C5B85_12280 [Pseudoclavibacter sp. AY1F1]|uniref:ABC transporter ATP-binding protein n=1 Tax=Pseudoclavibacter sp. AY1F1 TaxID=2080583 RepID=UPI000CE7AB30|nr:ABC transporter ATP-binding protein [Pseudoclavibacter sp. AY1F1]PPF43915.1 hypothetical protein C5B85_12280 [Pseudoclavibacter sp. AY1F1]